MADYSSHGALKQGAVHETNMIYITTPQSYQIFSLNVEMSIRCSEQLKLNRWMIFFSFERMRSLHAGCLEGKSRTRSWSCVCRRRKNRIRRLQLFSGGKCNGTIQRKRVTCLNADACQGRLTCRIGQHRWIFCLNTYYFIGGFLVIFWISEGSIVIHYSGI